MKAEYNTRKIYIIGIEKNRPARNRSGGPVSTVKQLSMHPNPRPARRRNGDALASRGLGLKAPAGVQRAEPSGARRVGAPAARRARRIGAGAGQRPAAVRAGRLPGEA